MNTICNLYRNHIDFSYSHAHRQSTSPQLNDVQNVAKSEDNFPNVIALEDSLSMFSVI
jgi:hypothetical protein